MEESQKLNNLVQQAYMYEPLTKLYPHHVNID